MLAEGRIKWAFWPPGSGEAVQAHQEEEVGTGIWIAPSEDAGEAFDISDDEDEDETLGALSDDEYKKDDEEEEEEEEESDEEEDTDTFVSTGHSRFAILGLGGGGDSVDDDEDEEMEDKENVPAPQRHVRRKVFGEVIDISDSD